MKLETVGKTKIFLSTSDAIDLIKSENFTDRSLSAILDLLNILVKSKNNCG